MIQYIQNKVISGELDTGNLENDLYGNHATNTSARNPNNQISLNLSGIRQRSPDRSHANEEDSKYIGLRIKGDFKLEGDQKNVDIQQEYNKVDILFLKYEKIVLSLERALKSNSKSEFADLQRMMAEFQTEMSSMNKYFYLRHREYTSMANEFKSLARESEKEIEDLKASLNKQIETANGLEEDLVFYKKQLMEYEPQAQEGLTRS